MDKLKGRLVSGTVILVSALLTGCIIFSMSIIAEYRRVAGEREAYLGELLNSVEMEFSPFIQIVSTASLFTEVLPLSDDAHEVFLKRMFSSSASSLLYGIGIFYEPYVFSGTEHWYGPYIRFDDPAGGSYSITYDWSSPEYDYTGRDWYRQLLQADRSEIAIISPYFDTDYTYITIGTPFYRDGKKAGVVTADMIFPLLEDFLEGHRLDGFEGAYLTTSENRLIYSLKAIPGAEAEIMVEDQFYNLNVRKWAVKNRKKIIGFDLKSRSSYFRLYGYLDERRVLKEVLSRRRPAITVFILVWLVSLLLFLVYLRLSRQRARNTELNRENIMLRDEIKKREEAESQLQFLAYHDMVTLLDNLYSFFDNVPPPTGKQDRRQLIQISLDNIRELSFILEGGIIDRLLLDLSERMKKLCGEEIRLFRGRGFAFYVVVDDESPEKAKRLADGLSVEFSRTFLLNKRNIRLRFQIGIAPFASAGSLDHLLKMAQSTISDKQNPDTGGVSLYNSEIEERKSYLAALDTEMVRGAFTGELKLYYQPIISTNERQIAGLEALVRWESSYFNRLISPGDFIPTAEENGCIIDLGWFVLREVMKALAGRLKAVDWFVSVNVSPMQFLESGFPEQLERMIENYGVDKSRLKLEITETSAASAVQFFWKSVERLIGMGFRLAIDDFGTGESSFGRLYTYDFDTLKIDRSLITDIVENPKHQQIFQAILQLGKVLDDNVVAEGVENEEEHSLLRSFGLKYAQGYLYSKPQPLDVLLETTRDMQQPGSF